MFEQVFKNIDADLREFVDGKFFPYLQAFSGQL